MLNYIPNIDLEITSACNLNCPGCWGPPRTIKSRPIEEYKQLLLNLKTFGLKNIALSGGEPTLVKGIDEFIKYANQELELDVFLQTNGKNLIELLPKIAPYLHTASISLESSTPEKDFRRKKEGFEMAIKGIKHLINNYPNIHIKIGTCVFKQNIRDLENIGNLLIKMGFNSKNKNKYVWKLYQITKFGNGANDQLLPSMLLKNAEFKQKVKQVKEKFSGQIKIVSISSDEMGAYCIVVRPNGEVAVNDNSKNGEEIIVHNSILDDFPGAIKSILLAQNKKHIVERLEETYFTKMNDLKKSFKNLNPKQRLEELYRTNEISNKTYFELRKRFNKQTTNEMDQLSENVINTFPAPYSIAKNFLINKKQIQIPYVCYESGVIAAASLAAKLCKNNGGFIAEADEQIMTGQIIYTNVKNTPNFKKKIDENKEQINRWINEKILLLKKEIKVKEIEIKIISSEKNEYLSLFINFDVNNYTGARTIAEICSSIAPKIQFFAPESIILMALHTDYLTKRLARAKAFWPLEMLATKVLTGEEVAKRIVDLYEYSTIDPTRAITSNKGVLNGITAFATATGNDVPMIEANINSYSVRNGVQKPLVKYYINNKNELVGEIELPLALGIKGGSSLHPYAKITQDITKATSSKDYAKIGACVGLAQNLAAMRAIVSHEMIIGNKKLERKLYGQTLRSIGTISAATHRPFRDDKTTS
ncbi:MAG: radical SAM protein [Sphaerochaetaceae bacterium]|nr:radical SAM protein [Sphaerochaetaceae bacterium]